MNCTGPFSPSRYDSSNYLTEKLQSIIKSNNNVLDVGCGKLYFLEILNKINKSVNYLGIDLNPKTNMKFKKNIKSRIIQQSIISFKTKNKFDLIVCLWVLEHIKNDKLAQKIMFNHVKKNGYLIIAVPTIWTWPLEFGRHGFHYYSLGIIKNITANKQLKVREIYTAGGLLGLLFMIVYNWPRFLILIPSFILYKILSFSKKTTLTWQQFSKKVIDVTWYRYHKSPMLVHFHNTMVQSIVKIDNLIKIFPQSYIIILQKS